MSERKFYEFSQRKRFGQGSDAAVEWTRDRFSVYAVYTSACERYIIGKSNEKRKEIQKMKAKDKENLSDSGKTENGRKAVERQTALGTIRADMEYPYPCVPSPGITEEKDGGLVIITASHVFRIRNGETEISPVLYQNCMHPEIIHIDPVQIRIDSGEICFQVRDQQWIIRESEASSVEILPWKAEIKKRSCIPCTNCGRCSW